MSRSSVVPGRGRIWWLLWVLPVSYALFSIPSLTAAVRFAIDYQMSTPEQQVELRRDPLAALVSEVNERAPADEPVFIDFTQQQNMFLFGDRQLLYWLYPRTAYSVAALKAMGVDVNEFAASHRIGWKVDERGIRRIDTGGDSPSIKGDERVGAIAPNRALLRSGLLATLAVVYFAFLGWWACSVARLATSFAGSLERLAVAYLVGLGLVSTWTLFCFASGIGVRLSTVMLPGVPAVYGWVRSHVPGRRHPNTGPFGSLAPTWWRPVPDQGERVGGLSSKPPLGGDRVALFVACTVAAAMIGIAVTTPMLGYDDRFFWSHKGKIMATEQHLDGPSFTDEYRVHARYKAHYPLLIPSAESVTLLFAGSTDDQVPKILFPLFTISMVIIFISGLAAMRGSSHCYVAGLSLLLIPYYCGNGGFTGYPDICLATFLTAAVVFFVRAAAGGPPRLYGLSSFFLLMTQLTKPEGSMYVVVFVVVMLGGSVVRAEDRRGTFGRLCAWFFPALVFMGIHHLGFTSRALPGIDPDNYLRLLTLDQILSHLNRAPAITAAAVREFFLTPRMGYVGSFVAVACAVRWRLLASREISLPLLFVGGSIAGFCVPFLVCPDPWTLIWSWSAARLFSQVAPIAMWGGYLALLPMTDGRASVSPQPARLAPDSTTATTTATRANNSVQGRTVTP